MIAGFTQVKLAQFSVQKTALTGECETKYFKVKQ